MPLLEMGGNQGKRGKCHVQGFSFPAPYNGRIQTGWGRRILRSATAVTVTIPGYKIEHLIAEGGTASVYLAIQESLGRHVAIKVLRHIDNPAQLNRFLNEGRIIASLNHRNVINIHDVGVTDERRLDDRRPYISMEYLEGGDLDARIQQKVDLEDALRWVKAIGTCLAFVHQKGIIHRDIKPGNILFHKDGTLILSDFGTAKQEDSDAKLTLEGCTFGSPYYISPEQAASKELDGRTDIYSLGIVLYEMLTGNKPYKGDSHIETIVAHLSDPLPVIPPELSRYHTLIKKMIAKSPDDRFASAAELVRFVQHLLKPVKPIWRMRRVYAGAAGIILGVGGTMFLRDSNIPDSNEHPVAEGMTTSEVAVAESPPELIGAPTQEPGDPVSETFATPDDNHDPSTPRLTADEEANSEPSSNIVHVSAPSDPSGEKPASTGNDEQRIEKLLSQAAAALKEHRLTNPKNNNAYFYYQRILELRPQNEPALTGIDSVADTYADFAEFRLKERDYDAAEKYLHRGLTIRPENARLLALQKETNIGRLLAKAATALKEYRLTTPKNDNAYYYYQRVLELQPNHENALQGITRIANAYADLAESKLDQFDYQAARQYLHRGLTIQPHNSRLQALEKNTNAFRDAPGRLLKKIFSPFS